MAKTQYLDLAGVQALWTKICANDTVNKNAIEAVAADVAVLNASAETAGSVDNKIAT